ncbi:Fic family protein [Cryptosporangium sp. NPDC048952]|uniref:Fic family protein n=1 Tax=Cryptosporangium sp. NPDC048952 TaxID=3363961 RepID=UPI003717E4AC
MNALPASAIAQGEDALREIAALDQAHGEDLGALGVLLLRTESMASSKIESVEASLDDYARALHGSRANASATSMAAATSALGALLTQIDGRERIDADSLLAAHAALMADDPTERDYAGRWRDMQNWIGGSDHSPRNALFVPPPPDLVESYVDDLLRFANRDDLPTLAQAAISHAQFESIHPFTDGNGRIGRALINAILRRRRATTRVVVPLASALVARRERYFDHLGAYRDGDVEPIVRDFALASRIAAAESRTTVQRLMEISLEWSDVVGRVRAGSAAAKLLAILPAQPVVAADDVAAATGAPLSSVYAAIERLDKAGVLRPLTNRKREQIWGATLILQELDELGARIARAWG